MLEPQNLEPNLHTGGRTRTELNLNLRFSLGVQGLNQGSGLNFGIPKTNGVG